jgi:hypothetical protein
MKKLDAITYNAFEFDDAVQIVTEQFNELKRSNATVEYKDIDVTFGLFRRTWVILVYEYDDQAFGKAEEFVMDSQPDTARYTKPTHIGMMPGLDPKDPDWREKQEAWARSVSSGS